MRRRDWILAGRPGLVAAAERRVVSDHEIALGQADTFYRVGQQEMRTVLQPLIALQIAQLALLRVQSEQLGQRVNLHLVLGGSFAPPLEFAATSNQEHADEE